MPPPLTNNGNPSTSTSTSTSAPNPTAPPPPADAKPHHPQYRSPPLSPSLAHSPGMLTPRSQQTMPHTNIYLLCPNDKCRHENWYHQEGTESCCAYVLANSLPEGMVPRVERVESDRHDGHEGHDCGGQETHGQCSHHHEHADCEDEIMDDGDEYNSDDGSGEDDDNDADRDKGKDAMEKEGHDDDDDDDDDDSDAEVMICCKCGSIMEPILLSDSGSDRSDRMSDDSDVEWTDHPAR